MSHRVILNESMLAGTRVWEPAIVEATLGIAGGSGSNSTRAPSSQSTGSGAAACEMTEAQFVATCRAMVRMQHSGASLAWSQPSVFGSGCSMTFGSWFHAKNALGEKVKQDYRCSMAGGAPTIALED